MLSFLISMSVHALRDFWQSRINCSPITQRRNTQFGYHRACSENGSSLGRQAQSSPPQWKQRVILPLPERERDIVGFVCDNINIYSIFKKKIFHLHVAYPKNKSLQCWVNWEKDLCRVAYRCMTRAAPPCCYKWGSGVPPTYSWCCVRRQILYGRCCRCCRRDLCRAIAV